VASNDGDRDSLIKTDYITVREAVVHPPTLSGFNKIESVPGAEGDNFYQISAVSKNIAYLATNKNRIYKTTDGGENWSEITPQIQSNIVGATPKVNFINENIGSVALSVDDGGNDYDYSKVYGYVWCTRDGGQTWSQRFNVNQDQIHHLQQVTENIVYISGSARLGVTSTRWFKKIIYDPSTGSYTLTSITPLPTSRPHVKSAHWLNQTTGIAVGQYNVYNFTTEIFKTVDGGSSWQSIQSNLPVFDYSRYMFSDRFVQMLDEDTYVLVQTYMNSSGVYQCNIWRTDNGGSSWSPAHFDTAPQQLVAMKIADNNLDGIAVGYDSTKACYITHDGGFNWEYTELPDLGGRYLYGCDITSDGSTWVNGSYRGLWTSSSELVADFTADVTSGSAPLEVHFTDLSQTGTSPISSWQWSFGDGENSLIQNPTHVYNAPGEYMVRLTVSDGVDSDTKEAVNYISVLGSSHAVITAVEDVPEDQGGWVSVHFTRSANDTDVLDAQRAAEDSLEMYTVEINDGSGWLSSNSTVAYGANTYSILVHTPVDSSAHSNGLLDFRVIAGMMEGNYSSSIVQGYSVDNLAPAVPVGLSAVMAEARVQLDWDASLDNDFQYYNIYRSENENFTIEGATILSSESNNAFLDENVETDRTYYYKVTAIDFHGNESDASLVASIQVAIVDIPDNFELAQNYPNPFNPTTTISYALSEVSDVTLMISSLTGRRIRSWNFAGQQAGWHEVMWDGKDISGNTISTGIYIYTLKAGNFVDTRKMVFMK
jgi:PKD repeat protein